MPEELTRALLTIAFGALAGGLTNTVAIWMLFHPYTPPKLFKRPVSFLQGAIPKNQARLAAAVGRTVGQKLLTDEDMAEIFAEPSFRRAFDDHLADFLETVLHRERGSLRQLIPSQALPQVEEVVDEVVEWGLENFAEYLTSDLFAETMGDRAQEIVASIADEPIAGVLTPAREAAISEAVDEWLTNAVESDDFRTTVDAYLARAADNLLQEDRTLEEVLPLGLIGTVERAIAGYLPLAIHRLGKLLEDRDARLRFEAFVHDLLHGFLKDLKFHQRVVAKLIMTDNTVDNVLATIETEGTERLAEMLQEEAIQNAMAGGINEAVVDFLRRPVVAVMGNAEDESILEARATLTDWIVNMARDPENRSILLEKLNSALDKAGARTWGQVFERIPPEQVTHWFVTAARSEPASNLLGEVANRLVTTLLDRPIGTPSTWLPEGSPRRIEEALGDPLWEWLQTQVPTVVRQIDVADRVEQKVLDFPMPKLEDMVRKVTDRELRLIVRLGYVLGAFIGILLVTMNALL